MSQQIQISGGAKVRDLQDVIIGTSGVLSSLAFNVSNGVPKLDVNGKILVSQLPNSVMEYKGTWNATTNTPTLADGTGNQGDVYLVSVGGSINLGSGVIVFVVSDQVIYSGSIWQKASGTNGTVTSVGLSTNGGAITIGNSPITTSGVISANFNGTNLQYVNGAGNLTTFPTLMTSVGLTMPSAFTVTNSPLTGAGGTLAVTGAGTTAQYIRGDGSLATFPTIATEAQRLITEVYNETGATLTKGTVVYINGGHGNLPTITKAIATGDATSAQTYGIVQANITDNNNGYVVVIGSLTDLDTSAYVEGTQLYLSSTTAGAWTSTKQYAPAHLVYVAIVTRSHPTQGVVEVRIQNGFEMDELHNVSAQSPANGGILQYVTSTGLWTAVAGTTTNIAEGTNLYYTDVRSRAALSFVAGSGAYNSTTGVITIPTNNNQITNGSNYITLGSLSAGVGISYNNTTGVITNSAPDQTVSLTAGAGISVSGTYPSFTIASTITQYTDALARLAISLTTTGTSGAATYNNTTGVLNIPQYIGGVTSVFGRTGAVVAAEGDYSLTQLSDVTITSPTTNQVLKYNGTAWINDTDANTGTVTSVAMTVPTGLSIAGSPITSSGTLAVTLTAGYSIPTTASQTNWDTAYTNRIISLTTVGTSGSANLSSNTLNIPTYTLVGLGGQPQLNGTGFVKASGTTISYDNSTYLTTTSAASTYLPLVGGALSGGLTSSSNAVFKYVGGYALKLDSTSATEENDLRFAKNGVDYGAIQTSGSTGDFEFYVDTTQLGGWVKMINILKNGTGTTFTGNISAGNLSGTNTGDQTLAGLGGQPALNGTGFVKATGTTITYDNSTYLTTSAASSTYLPLTGGVLSGDLLLTKASIPKIEVNATDTGSYSYFGNQESGILKTYFLYLNSLFVDVDRRQNLEIRNQAGPITFWANAAKALTIANSGAATFTSSIDTGGNISLTNNTNGGAVINTLNSSTGTSAYSGLLVGNNAVSSGGGYLLLGGNYPTSGPYTSDGVYMFSNRPGGLTIAAEAGTIKLVTGSTIKGTMLANGNLGLNETNPTNLLHLAGASATPSLRLGSVTVGYWYDIGRENQTTGDFLINGTYNSVSSGTLLRIHQTNFTLTTAGTINAKGASSLASMGGAAFLGTGEFLSTGSNAGYFWENRSGGVTSSANWYGWYTSAAIVSLYNGNANIFSIAGASGNVKVFANLGIGRDPTTVLDVIGSTGNALVYFQNTSSVGYSGIDIFRQGGAFGGSLWCANDSAGATNNRNAITLAARTAGEKVIIVGGGYDPTVTGGLTIAGAEAKLLGVSAHLVIEGSSNYAYIQLTGTTTSTRNAYFIQNNTGVTTNGVAAGSAYMYFDVGQQMEFVWAGTSRIQFTSAGNVTATAFFESSDSRLKTLIQDNYQTKGIASITPKLYTKNGKLELGYYAQDFVGILDSAISKGSNDMLSLSYREVLVAKVYALEQEIKELKAKNN